MYREELAKWMFDTSPEAATHRGLDPTDLAAANAAPRATPTPLLAAVNANATQARTENNVRTEINVTVDGQGKDGKQVGDDIGDKTHDALKRAWSEHLAEVAGG